MADPAHRSMAIVNSFNLGYRLSSYPSEDLILHGPSLTWNIDINFPLKDDKGQFRNLPLIFGASFNTAGEYFAEGGLHNWGTGARFGVGTGSYFSNDGPWHAWKTQVFAGARFNSNPDIPIYPSFGFEGSYNWGEDDFAFGGVFLVLEANYVPGIDLGLAATLGWRIQL